MNSNHPSRYCYNQFVDPFKINPSSYVNLTNLNRTSLLHFCQDIVNLEADVGGLQSYYQIQSEREGEYTRPMVLIGIYIAVASLVCIIAMVLDLSYGFRTRKLWFPSKYFSLNAASVTVIAVAVKLPVDLTTPMPGMVDQVAKFGGIAFMCTMMANFMPSLASMDDKSLLANVTGLSILIITIIVNIFVQIRTHVINPNMFDDFLMRYISALVPYIYIAMLLFLLSISISSSITIPTTKKILESKYQTTSKKLLNDYRPQRNRISTVHELRQLAKRYWIMIETASPQFVMASNPLSSAAGVICAISMAMYLFLVWELVRKLNYETYKSVYKWSMVPIVVTQSIGIILGSIAPLFRCFTLLSFKSFGGQNKKHFLVFQVEKYWTQKLYDWKESRVSRVMLDNFKNAFLSFCIGFQKGIVVSCKIIGLLPIVVIIFVRVLRSCVITSDDTGDDVNEDLSGYVLLLEDNMQLAEKTILGISNSLNGLIDKAEKKQQHNLLKLIETSVTFDGVETFDSDQIPSLLPVEVVNSWSLSIISLTCIAIVIPNVHKDRVDSLMKSVGEGLVYTNLVEESLNRDSVYANIRKAAMNLWLEVEHKCMWLDKSLEKSGYEGKTVTMIVESFAENAKEIVTEFNRSTTNGELVEKEDLLHQFPPNVIVANSMYQIAESIIHVYKSKNLEIVEDELFTRLSHMIADILAACLTNIPRIITRRCNESVIEKREASVVGAIHLLGGMSEIIRTLEARELPNMGPHKMGFIDEWRLYLKQP